MLGRGARRTRILATALLAAGIATWGALQVFAGTSGTAAASPRLALTGLYSDIASHAVDPRNMPYSPQYPLWSDGATKRRWLFLPPGTSIDASDRDVWAFPAGTKIWKEFSFGGRRVETRLLEALAAGQWRFAAYAWNADETDAVLVPPAGLHGAAEIRPGIRHDIPGVLDCRACHDDARRTEVLGFGALQLSSDRDPNAPHAEPPEPGMATLESLIRRKLLRNYPAEWAEHPPRIPASSPTARAALGYLHANCGNCHHPAGTLDSLSVLLRHGVVPGAGEAAMTAVNRTGRFRIPGVPPGGTFLLRPGDPEHSAIAFRVATRDPFRQMPPLGTKIADPEAVPLIERWIREDLPAEAGRPSGETTH